MIKTFQTYKLKGVTSKIGSGSTPRGGDSAYIKEGISLIRSQNILDYTFSYNGLAHINEQQAKELNGVTIYKDDVLINITGDSVARVSQVPDDVLPARVNQHVAILRANPDLLNAKYLKYFLLQPRTKEALLSISASGATRKAITKVMLEEFEINLPPLHEQQAIAEILSSLDDKIELNLQTNKTLEEMANALYKHWFVDFGPFKDDKFIESELGLIPECWEVKPLEHIANFKNGKGLKEEDKFDEGKYIILGSNGIVGRTNKVLFEEPIIAIGRVGANYGAIHYSLLPCWISDNAVTSQPINLNNFWFLLKKLQDINYKNFAVGSAQPLITQGAIKNILTQIPQQIILDDYNAKTKELYLQINENNIESELIKQTRDYLLPKLISGEIRVKEAAKAIKERI